MSNLLFLQQLLFISLLLLVTFQTDMGPASTHALYDKDTGAHRFTRSSMRACVLAVRCQIVPKNLPYPRRIAPVIGRHEKQKAQQKNSQKTNMAAQHPSPSTLSHFHCKHHHWNRHVSHTLRCKSFFDNSLSFFVKSMLTFACVSCFRCCMIAPPRARLISTNIDCVCSVHLFLGGHTKA